MRVWYRACSRGAARRHRSVIFPDPAEWAPACLCMEAGTLEAVMWWLMVRWRPASATTVPACMTGGSLGRQALGPCLLPSPIPSCGPRCLTPSPLGTPILRAWILASSSGSPSGHKVFDSTASDARCVLRGVHVQ